MEVLIVTYGCYAEPFTEVTYSSEHKAVGIFAPERLGDLPMPEGYKRSIRRWVTWEHRTPADAATPGNRQPPLTTEAPA